MQKLVFEVETATPLFLSGADQQKCELRAQSWRGALRYWTRALLGASGLGGQASATNWPDKLNEKERELWGHQEEGSPILVRIRGAKVQHRPCADLQLENQSNAGQAYLLFTVKMNNRPCIPPRTSFNLEFVTLGKEEEGKRLLQQAAAAFWCVAFLGGIGTRARRGGGQFVVRRITNTLGIELPSFHLPPTKDELKTFLHTNLEKAIRLFASQRAQTQAVFPTFAKDRVIIAVLPNTAETVQQAMNEFGQKFQGGFRLRRGMGEGGDYDVAKGIILQGNAGFEQQTIERAAFGLPLAFRFRSTKDEVRVGATWRQQGLDRRASPLWVHFQLLENGQVATVLTWFKEPLLPSEARLVAQMGRTSWPLARPSNKIIQDFLTHLQAETIFS